MRKAFQARLPAMNPALAPALRLGGRAQTSPVSCENQGSRGRSPSLVPSLLVMKVTGTLPPLRGCGSWRGRIRSQIPPP